MVCDQESEDSVKRLVLKYKDTDFGHYLLDYEQFELLVSFETQIKYQTEFLTCFFNQQPDSQEESNESSPQKSKKKIETKSMTNLTSDDEFNPFLTFLKSKTDVILPSKVSKKKAMEIWAEYKKVINKILPIVRSHISSQRCNITILLTLLKSYILRRGGNMATLMQEIDRGIKFLVEYMAIYYQLRLMSKQQTDLSEVFRFGAYQEIFKDREISVLINEAANEECYAQSKLLLTKFNEIVMQLKKIPKIGNYFELFPSNTHVVKRRNGAEFGF